MVSSFVYILVLYGKNGFAIIYMYNYIIYDVYYAGNAKAVTEFRKILNLKIN